MAHTASDIADGPELSGATERFLIDDQAAGAAPADVIRLLSDAAVHAADALPELLILARGGRHFGTRLRPYTNEVIHCLASGLESALAASRDAAALGLGMPRKEAEDALATAVHAYLEQSAA